MSNVANICCQVCDEDGTISHRSLYHNELDEIKKRGGIIEVSHARRHAGVTYNTSPRPDSRKVYLTRFCTLCKPEYFEKPDKNT